MRLCLCQCVGQELFAWEMFYRPLPSIVLMSSKDFVCCITLRISSGRHIVCPRASTGPYGIIL